jgi:hypothetical protein
MSDWKFGDVLERGKYEAPYHQTMRVMVITPIGRGAQVIFLRHEGPDYLTRVGQITTVSGWVKVKP